MQNNPSIPKSSKYNDNDDATDADIDDQEIADFEKGKYVQDKPKKEEMLPFLSMQQRYPLPPGATFHTAATNFKNSAIYMHHRDLLSKQTKNDNFGYNVVFWNVIIPT